MGESSSGYICHLLLMLKSSFDPALTTRDSSAPKPGRAGCGVELKLHADHCSSMP